MYTAGALSVCFEWYLGLSIWNGLQVRDEIEQLMDDDSDMAEMYLTDKKEQQADFAFFDAQKTGPHLSYVGAGGSISAPVSPVGSPVASSYMERRLEKSFSQKSRHDSMTSSRTTEVEELEMLLEAYFVVIDGTLNKLTSVPFLLPLSSPLLLYN